MVVIFFIEWRALYRVIVMVIFSVNNRKFALFIFKQNSWPPFNNDLGRKEKLFVCFVFVTIVTTGILKILLLTCHFRFYLNAG